MPPLVRTVVFASMGLLSLSQPCASVLRSAKTLFATQRLELEKVNAPTLLANYCAGCHSHGRAGLDLHGPLDFRSIRRERATWENVLQKLRAEEMPPLGSPQLSANDRRCIMAWIEEGLSGEPWDKHQGFVSRRLKRDEYLNTIHDLTGMRLQGAEDFPADDNGWDHSKAIPVLPAPLAANYLAVAEAVVKEISIDPPAGATPEVSSEHARALLAAFTRRAYRRTIRVEELESVFAACEHALCTGMSYEDAVRAALRVVLTSPHFLFVIENVTPDRLPASPGDQFALASRLSYFLWSSMPDERLLADAEEGLLRHNIEGHVKRMLKDGRSRAFVGHFSNYWLELGKLDDVQHVDADLRQALREETERFVGYILDEDRNALELLDAGYAFLNERLAQHYGIAGVRGEELRRVSLKGLERGGLITHGSIMALTSKSSETSPVLRGKWVLDNLLGTPPSAPPRGLLQAFSTTRKAFEPGTARQLLEKHRADAACAHCHAKIDPIGFALENFDARGAWRAEDASGPIDVTTTMPSGEALAGPASLRAYLRGKQALFLNCLSGKLLAYSLGRGLDRYDGAAIEHIAEIATHDQQRFAGMVLAVIKSPPFQRGWRSEAD